MDDLCEPPILMAGICGRHHSDDCISCSSSREMNNNHLDQLRARIRQLEADNESFRQRLELTGEFADGPDGIECRDDTIEILDERAARLKAENARLREELDVSRERITALWHGEQFETLHDALGMTWSEYQAWGSAKPLQETERD